MKRIRIVLMVAVAAFGAGDLVSSSQPMPPSQDTSLQARLIMHAGKGNGAPENTLPAMSRAVAAGFGFECDIQMSADKRIFTAHNASAKVYCGRDVLFKTMPWDDIAKIDVGRAIGGEAWTGTRPALLEEILPLMGDGRKSYIEVKTSAGVEIVPYIKKLVDAQSVATPKNMVFISFDKAICRALRKSMPEYEVLWLTLPCPEDEKRVPVSADELIASLREVGATGVDIRIDMGILTEAYIKKVKDAGFSFSVWTVDDPEASRVLLARGVDTITTNCAKETLEYMKSWKPTR